MAATEIVLIRHGESEWNARGLWQGQADPPLSPRGRAEVPRAAERVVDLAPAALYTSDLRRAFQTAEILGRTLGLEPRSDSRLREFHVGAWAGLTVAEIEKRWPGHYGRFRAREPDFRPGGGESSRELLARVLAALDEIGARHAGERVVIVSHGGVARSLVPGTSLENLQALPLRRFADGAWRPR
jgi:broad specificity phosphatase PhoE